MRAHYALVDDLITWDEYEKAVSALNPNPDDEARETAAAEAVAAKFCRLHPTISKLSNKPTLCSFFCRVIEVGDIIRYRMDISRGFVTGSLKDSSSSYLPEKYKSLSEIAEADDIERYRRYEADNNDSVNADKEDSSESQLLIRKILVGDETGECLLVFRDMKVAATEEIRVGDILEVAAKFRSLSNVIAVDLRYSDKPVELRDCGVKRLKPYEITLRIISDPIISEYVARDGSLRKKAVCLIYESLCGFGRLTIFDSDNECGLSEKFTAGAILQINNVMRRPSYFVDYTISCASDNLGELCVIEVEDSDALPKPDITRICDLFENRDCIGGLDNISIQGRVTALGSINSYLRTKNREDSTSANEENILLMRRCVISDGTGEVVLVIWGEQKPLAVGDMIEAYNSALRRSSFTNRIEVHAGRNSAVTVTKCEITEHDQKSIDHGNAWGREEICGAGFIFSLPDCDYFADFAKEEAYFVSKSQSMITNSNRISEFGENFVDESCEDLVVIRGTMSENRLNISSKKRMEYDQSICDEAECVANSIYEKL